jgi:hypothetical protein
MTAAPTLEFLVWLGERERTYAEAMEAWHTSCPRLSVWEDALADGLVRVVGSGAGPTPAMVALTPRGSAALAHRNGSTDPVTR